MGLKDFIVWLNFKEFKLVPIEIIKGILANIFFIILSPIVITILGVIIALIISYIFPSQSIAIINFLIYLLGIFGSLVFAASIGYLYGRHAKHENRNHESFKNFTIGFFIIGFLFSILAVLLEILGGVPIRLVIADTIQVLITIAVASFVYQGCLVGEKRRLK